MTFLSIVLVLVLTAICVLHAIWGLRIWWPLSDEGELARAVAGFDNISKMPDTKACVVVAIALAFAAYFALALGFQNVIQWRALTIVAGSGIALAFLMRGLVGYFEFWRRLTPEQPFRTLDHRYYSPLCLAMGSGFAILVVHSFAKA